jgi:hypothetical protein
MAENNSLVQQGFRILHPQLAGYVAQELSREYKDNWWKEVLYTLDDQARDLPDSGDYAELVDSLDIANCLRLLDRKWNDVFRKKLSLDYRTWSKELMGVRNKLAHIGLEDFSDDDTWRALDTMARLCEAFDDEAAEEIRKLLRTARYGAAEGSTTVAEAANPVTTPSKKREGVLNRNLEGLPSWRDVIEPHPDVAQGRYKNAEFAADLAQVARGEGAFEYRDPVEFFARTYVTEGMKGLLVQAIKRVNGKDGEPVIQLKTAFGGGKTHSMLALYHMMRGRISIEKVPNLKPVIAEAGVSALPKANVAVLVGTALDPTRAKRPQNFPGITINTLWGEMAAQLAESAGKPELYDYVKDADRKGVSPGSEALKNLFDACAPCLVLMDELVAYAKKLYGVNGLPAGSFDNFITFIQEITEAARASKNSLVVASIPESEREIGGESGQLALETIEHTFGRMEAIWKPVAANEGFEVVRRRLFLDCKDPEARDRVCTRFSQMYAENPADFPLEAKEVEYRDRMISCYPIHPEIFDRLYNDWATLESFQRTRGVLRLMAAVIHELWMGNDASAMIMPGSIPLDVPNVRDELIRYLPRDGIPSSAMRSMEKALCLTKKTRACRAMATNWLPAALHAPSCWAAHRPSARSQCAVSRPPASALALCSPARTLPISTMRSIRCRDRWPIFIRIRPVTDTGMTHARRCARPFRTAQRKFLPQMWSLRSSVGFAPCARRLRLPACMCAPAPLSMSQTIRLCGLSFCAQTKNTKHLLSQIAPLRPPRTSSTTEELSPRIYRNMLAFVAPDQELMFSLRQGVREYLAWASVRDDSEDLNLDAAQNRETENNLRRSNETVELAHQRNLLLAAGAVHRPQCGYENGCMGHHTHQRRSGKHCGKSCPEDDPK